MIILFSQYYCYYYSLDILWEANQKEIILSSKTKNNNSNPQKTVLKLILPKSRLGTENDVQIGPIPIGINDSITTLEEKIQVIKFSFKNIRS